MLSCNCNQFFETHELNNDKQPSHRISNTIDTENDIDRAKGGFQPAANDTPTKKVTYHLLIEA